MTVAELRTVTDPYGKIEIADAESCVTLAYANEERYLIHDYDRFPVDLVIAGDCALRVYVFEPSTEPGVSF